MEDAHITPEGKSYDGKRVESVPAAVLPAGRKRLNIEKLRNHDFVAAATAKRMDSGDGAAFDVFINQLNGADSPEHKAGDIL
jgi:hypothetical protein